MITEDILSDLRDYDTPEKIDKKYSYFCKSYGALFKNGFTYDEDFSHSPKTQIINHSIKAKNQSNNSNNVFLRNAVKKKAIIPIQNDYFQPKKANIRKNSSELKVSRKKKPRPKQSISFNFFEEAKKVSIAEKMHDSLKEATIVNYSKNYQGKEKNNLAEFFGNSLIAAYFESLILQTTETLSKSKENEPLNLSPWYFFLFVFLSKIYN